MTVLQYCAAVLFCICFGGLLSGILQQFHVRGFSEADDFGAVLVGTLTFQGAACALIFVFFRRYQISWRAGFGFNGPDLKRALLRAVVVFLVALPAAWLLQFASVFALTKAGHPPDEQMAVQLIESAKSWWTRSYLAFFDVVLAPVAEEFIFRGLLYPFIKQLGWPRLALFGLSLLFAVIHFDKAIFLSLFVLALALTWLYEKTDNLLAPILAHMLFNATNLVMLVLTHFHVLPE